jgi:hypothetical protein
VARRLLELLLLLLVILGRHARPLLLRAMNLLLLVLRRARCLAVVGVVLAAETHVWSGLV